MTGDLERASPLADAHLVHCGAELVDLAETYYARVFALALDLLLSAVAVALLMTPLRAGPSEPTFTLAILGAMGLAGLLARRRRLDAYYSLRRNRTALILGAGGTAAALLLDDPLNSPLWWVAFAVISLCAIAGDSHLTASCAGVLILGFVLGIALHDHLTLLVDEPRIGLQAAAFAFWALLLHATIEGAAGFMLRLGQSPSGGPLPPRSVTAWAAPDETPRPERTDTATFGLASTATVDRTLKLTARQLEVVVLLCDGLKQSEIAQALDISVRQVERHVRDAKNRMGARSSAELVTIAIEGGVVAPRTANKAV